MRWLCIALLCVSSIAHAQAQDLGHRLPSSAGLNAGVQLDQGLYVGDRFVWFGANEVHDRNGDVVPIENLDIDTTANALGVAGTLRFKGLYVTAALSVPLVRVSLTSDAPEASVDRLGLGNVFIEPLQLGQRSKRFDVVASWSVYAPTGQGAHMGVGRPEWAQQLAAGGTLFFDDRRGWRLSALASYQFNKRKRDIDITRGDTVLVQGGLGGPVYKTLEVGITGYALWQVTDDTGADLPPVLAGARERAFGLGPEVDILFPAARARLDARIAWDIDGRTRPVGTILMVGVSFMVWN